MVNSKISAKALLQTIVILHVPYSACEKVKCRQFNAKRAVVLVVFIHLGEASATAVKPRCKRPYRLPCDRQKALDEVLEEIKALGWIEPVNDGALSGGHHRLFLFQIR